jgi:hypothetical protein
MNLIVNNHKEYEKLCRDLINNKTISDETLNLAVEKLQYATACL